MHSLQCTRYSIKYSSTSAVIPFKLSELVVNKIRNSGSSPSLVPAFARSPRLGPTTLSVLATQSFGRTDQVLILEPGRDRSQGLCIRRPTTTVRRETN